MRIREYKTGFEVRIHTGTLLRYSPHVKDSRTKAERIMELGREEKLITEQEEAKIISTMNRYDSLPEHGTNKLMKDIFNMSKNEDRN